MQLQCIPNSSAAAAAAPEELRQFAATGGARGSLQVSCRAYYSPTGGVLRHRARLRELVAAHQQGRREATQMPAEVSVLERLANHGLCGGTAGGQSVF